MVNQNKIKCIMMTRNTTVKGTLCTEKLTFEQVGDFKYLDEYKRKNNMHYEIGMRLNINRCYFTMKETFSSWLLSTLTKESLNRTYIIVMYACKTSTYIQRNKEKLQSFKKNTKKILSPVNNNNLRNFQKK